jgi:hypothetical protein
MRMEKNAANEVNSVKRQVGTATTTYEKVSKLGAQTGFDIAPKLNVKEHCIRNYIHRIFEKLGVSSRVELILYVFSQRDHGISAAAIQCHVRGFLCPNPVPVSKPSWRLPEASRAESGNPTRTFG